MLRRLSVENYALIDRLDMELSPSLNIITGETGAGKSILLGALALLLGARSEGNTAKDTNKNCIVEGTFDIEGHNLNELFESNDLEYAGVTTIRRIISPAGKSRAYVNDLPVQLTTLKELGAHLIDIHSQHQSLLIADDTFRTNIVDSVAENSQTLQQYTTLFTAMRTAQRDLTALRNEATEARKEQDYIQYQLEQLKAMKLSSGEEQELEQQQSELSNAEQIREALSLGAEALSEDERGVLITLKGIHHNISRLAAVYPRSSEFSERIQSTFVELRDIESEISRESNRIESDPKRLEIVDQRLKAIYDLCQKHHAQSAEQLLEIQNNFEQRLTHIADSAEAIAQLETTIDKLKTDATSTAAKITVQRKKASVSIQKHVESVLSELGMPNASFFVEILPLLSLTAGGADSIRFMFTANKGITAQAVEKIASGGEISRVMLALKAQVARSTKLPTIIFDEIDTGVSGKIADKMGEIISELGASMQVINITHLPQVASKGETHFIVYKNDSATATTTHLRLLSNDERIDEIAKMLSGSTITDAATTQARLLLGL